jgi:uncharacterized OsmC-like protein
MLGHLLGHAAVLHAPRRAALSLRLRAGRCMSAGSPQEVFVEETLTGGLEHTLRSGRHLLRGDLAPEAGGVDAGPSPKELCMLSLALCTSMTVRLFATRSGFPLVRVRVRAAEHTQEGAHVPDGLSLSIELEGEQLTEPQRERLLRAASKCPVKQMLAGGMRDGVSTVLLHRPA